MNSLESTSLGGFEALDKHVTNVFYADDVNFSLYCMCITVPNKAT